MMRTLVIELDLGKDTSMPATQAQCGWKSGQPELFTVSCDGVSGPDYLRIEEGTPEDGFVLTGTPMLAAWRSRGPRGLPQTSLDPKL